MAAKTTDNPRDCRLVTLAGILPDADGLGLLIDLPNRFFFHKEAFFYPQYHHWLLHGVLGGVFTAVLLTCFARQHLRVALLAFAVFHLHLLCDLVGSRGPAPNDLWPIFYFGPFSTRPMWMWHGQWRLDGWLQHYKEKNVPFIVSSITALDTPPETVVEKMIEDLKKLNLA